MLEFIQVHTSRLTGGQVDPVAAVTWVNPQHIVRIDPCDSRDEHDGGELAMIIELSNGNELYVPLARTGEAEHAIAHAVDEMLIAATRRPIAAIEIE